MNATTGVWGNCWWVSWFSGDKEGPFTITTPWWKQKDADGRNIVVAAVRATVNHHESDVWDYIKSCYATPPENLEKRFCELKVGEPFSEGYPRETWMEWDMYHD